MGGATKISVCLSGIKSVNNNLKARLSVVYLTICIQHCDKDFYKYTRKLDFNVEPAITFFLKMLSAFLVRLDFFMQIFFMEDNAMDLGLYCL